MEDIRYKTGKIYAIVNKNDPEKAYIGSTKNSIKSRMSKHRHDCRMYSNRTALYKHIVDNCWDDWELKLIKDYPCRNRKELEAEESRIILSYPQALNKKKRF